MCTLRLHGLVSRKGIGNISPGSVVSTGLVVPGAAGDVTHSALRSLADAPWRQSSGRGSRQQATESAADPTRCQLCRHRHRR